jgi:hypothetical protein
MSAEVPGLMMVRRVISSLFRFSPSFTPPPQPHNPTRTHSNKHNYLLFPELCSLDPIAHLHTSRRKGLLFPIKTAVLFFASRHHGGTELGGKRYLFEITRLKRYPSLFSSQNTILK